MKYLIILSLASSVSAFSNSPGDEVSKELMAYTSLLDQRASGFNDELELKSLRIRTTLEAAVKIPAISNLSINPEIEYTFTKKSGR